MRAVAVEAEEVRRPHLQRRVLRAGGAVDERLRGMLLRVVRDRDRLVTGQRADHDVGLQLLHQALRLLDRRVGAVVRAADADELERVAVDRAARPAVARVVPVPGLRACVLGHRGDDTRPGPGCRTSRTRPGSRTGRATLIVDALVRAVAVGGEQRRRGRPRALRRETSFHLRLRAFIRMPSSFRTGSGCGNSGGSRCQAALRVMSLCRRLLSDAGLGLADLDRVAIRAGRGAAPRRLGDRALPEADEAAGRDEHDRRGRSRRSACGSAGR